MTLAYIIVCEAHPGLFFAKYKVLKSMSIEKVRWDVMGMSNNSNIPLIRPITLDQSKSFH